MVNREYCLVLRWAATLVTHHFKSTVQCIVFLLTYSKHDPSVTESDLKRAQVWGQTNLQQHDSSVSYPSSETLRGSTVNTSVHTSTQLHSIDINHLISDWLEQQQKPKNWKLSPLKMLQMEQIHNLNWGWSLWWRVTIRSSFFWICQRSKGCESLKGSWFVLFYVNSCQMGNVTFNLSHVLGCFSFKCGNTLTEPAEFWRYFREVKKLLQNI